MQRPTLASRRMYDRKRDKQPRQRRGNTRRGRARARCRDKNRAKPRAARRDGGKATTNCGAHPPSSVFNDVQERNCQRYGAQR